jgi:hypothetical protein
MATPFVSPDLFEIVVKYAQVKLKSGLSAIIVIKDEKQEEKYKDKVQVLKSQWKQPNWIEHNDLHSGSLVTDDVAGVKVPDYNIYRQLVLERFMRLWDVVDEKNNPVEINKDNLSKLDPSIAVALYEAWNKKVNAAEEDVGN